MEKGILREKTAKYEGKKFLHICEVCGKRAILTPEEAHDAGWDYPPMMYGFKVVSPRTCGTCGITETAWWQMAVLHKPFDELTDAQRETVNRICSESESILATED